MANQREIKTRIVSITNTRKITSTMEMVSTAKMKKSQIRLEKSRPYENKVDDIIRHLMGSSVSNISNPLFTAVANPSRALILQITGNRGLCGSYNTNIIGLSLKKKDELLGEGIESLVYAVGKKGANYMKFINEPVYRSIPNLDDKMSFEEAAKIGSELTGMFLNGEIHEVYIAYTRVLSSSSQKPDIIKLFPIEPVVSDDVANRFPTNYVFEPNPNQIFSYILPLYIKVKIYSCFLQSSFSENFARRVAMKNATDASSDMIKTLTVTYNRARQAKITNEIAEICGGAAALE